MKRSEMVNLIRDFVTDLEADYDLFFTRDEAEGLLAQMEQYGVLPPLTTLSAFNIKDNSWDPE